MKNNLLTIKVNDPQPLDCPKCETKHGYQYSDAFRMHYTSFHTPDGKYEGGEYSDGRCLNKGVATFCCNCGTRLGFKLIRTTFEEV